MSSGTTDQLLYQLKSRGPQAAATLAAACAITPMGAHKQLQALAGQGLVQAQDELQGSVRGVGRPKKIWRLTEAGHGRFPDRHGELSVQLIGHIGELLGPQVLAQLIAAREQAAEVQYLQRLAGARGLAARVRGLAELRAEEGYLARAEPEPGSDDGDGAAWLLIEDHCPICAAATRCQGFCRSEQALFQRVLGEGARVERSEHLLAGARRCVYRIRAVTG